MRVSDMHTEEIIDSDMKRLLTVTGADLGLKGAGWGGGGGGVYWLNNF